MKKTLIVFTLALAMLTAIPATNAGGAMDPVKQGLCAILGMDSSMVDVQKNGSGQIVQITLTKHEPHTFHGGECYGIILTVLRGAELPVNANGIPGVTYSNAPDGSGIWKDSVSGCDIAETGDFQFTATQNGKAVLTAHWQGNGKLSQFVLTPLVSMPVASSTVTAETAASSTPESNVISADDDLNRAWSALSPRQRTRLREEERNWIKWKDSLPMKQQNESTRERAKYIWSFVGQQ